MSGNHKKAYTADFLLLLISGGFPIGWTMSGFPPSIELAIACWIVTLSVLLHIIWTWTNKWNKRWRIAILVTVPILIIYFSWEPIKKQYILQHNPIAIAIPETHFTQWYLKLDYIQCDPPIIESNRSVAPFRIGVKMNGEPIDSFPHGLFVYAGLTNTIECGDRVILDANAKQYLPEFLLQRRNVRPDQEVNLNISNLLANAGNDQKPFKIADLVVTATNFIPLSVPYQDRQIKVVYEITTNR